MWSEKINFSMAEIDIYAHTKIVKAFVDILTLYGELHALYWLARDLTNNGFGYGDLVVKNLIFRGVAHPRHRNPPKTSLITSEIVSNRTNNAFFHHLLLIKRSRVESVDVERNKSQGVMRWMGETTMMMMMKTVCTCCGRSCVNLDKNAGSRENENWIVMLLMGSRYSS